MYNILNIECGGTKYFNYYLKVFKEGVWDVLSRNHFEVWEFLWCKNHQVYYQVFIFPQEKPSESIIYSQINDFKQVLLHV